MVGGILAKVSPSTIFLMVARSTFPLRVLGSLSTIRQLLNEATGPKGKERNRQES